MKKKVFILSLLVISFFYAPLHTLSGKVKITPPGSFLKEYLDHAEANNPGLKAAYDRWLAGRERASISGSLPDPVVSFTYFLREIETKTGPQNFRAGLMQKFPWFGKRRLSSRISSEKAEALKYDIQRMKLELFFKVKKLYYDHSYNIISIEIIRENISLLESLNKQVETMYMTGLASYSDMIRFSIELDKLRERERSLEKRSSSLGTALNIVMNRPADTMVKTETDIEYPDFSLDVNSLREVMRLHNPELKVLDHILLGEESTVKLQKKGYFPDISIGADIFSTGESAVPGTPGSGRDPFSLTVSFNLPVRLKKINSSVRAAEFSFDKAGSEKTDRENELISMLDEAVFRFNDSVRMISLYKNKLIPRAKEVLEVKRTEYATGRTTFIDLIDVQRTLLDFELILEKAGIESYQHLALIEKITGRPVSPDHEQKYTVPE